MITSSFVKTALVHSQEEERANERRNAAILCVCVRMRARAHVCVGQPRLPLPFDSSACKRNPTNMYTGATGSGQLSTGSEATLYRLRVHDGLFLNTQHVWSYFVKSHWWRLPLFQLRSAKCHTVCIFFFFPATKTPATSVCTS